MTQRDPDTSPAQDPASGAVPGAAAAEGGTDNERQARMAEQPQARPDQALGGGRSAAGSNYGDYRKPGAPAADRPLVEPQQGDRLTPLRGGQEGSNFGGRQHGGGFGRHDLHVSESGSGGEGDHFQGGRGGGGYSKQFGGGGSNDLAGEVDWQQDQFASHSGGQQGGRASGPYPGGQGGRPSGRAWGDHNEPFRGDRGGAQRAWHRPRDERDASEFGGYGGGYGSAQGGWPGGGPAQRPDNRSFAAAGGGRWSSPQPEGRQSQWQGPGSDGDQSWRDDRPRDNWARGQDRPQQHGPYDDHRHEPWRVAASDHGHPTPWRDLGDARPVADAGGASGDWRHSQAVHPHDPDYQQWRAEQLRNLDDDYRHWRQDRYRKYSDEFNAWRSQRASQSGSTAGNPALSGMQGTDTTGGAGGSTNGPTNGPASGSRDGSRETPQGDNTRSGQKTPGVDARVGSAAAGAGGSPTGSSISTDGSVGSVGGKTK